MKIKVSKISEIATKPSITYDLKVMSVDVLGFVDAKTRKIVISRRDKNFKRPKLDVVKDLTNKIKNEAVRKNFGLIKKK